LVLCLLWLHARSPGEFWDWDPPALESLAPNSKQEKHLTAPEKLLKNIFSMSHVAEGENRSSSDSWVHFDPRASTADSHSSSLVRSS
jgi:hypothetical protein